MKRIHWSRRRRAVLARYEEFVLALTPENLREIDVRIRPKVVEAIRRSFPPNILVYVWRDGLSFEEVIDKCRWTIARSLHIQDPFSIRWGAR